MNWTIDDVWQRCEMEPNSGCWLWGYRLNGGGYPYADIDGKSVRVTRLVLSLKLGRALAPTEFACHQCDTPACVNPGHLFAGTASDNARDAARKGRLKTARIGEANSAARLTEQDVIAIRAGVLKISEIANTYGISESAAYDAVTGASWRHVGGSRRSTASKEKRVRIARYAAITRWAKRSRS